MQRAVMLSLLLFICAALPVEAAEEAFDRFLTGFDYDTRADMKTDSKKLLKLLEEKKAVLVDIRFPEETRAWRMGFGLFIPLHELPKRLAELPKDKIIASLDAFASAIVISM